MGGRLDHYDDFGNQYTPRVGIIYLPTENSAIKTLYGRGFRAATAMEMAGNALAKGNEEIEPETIDCYELIYLQKGDNYKVNLTGFYNDWKNGIGWAPYSDPNDSRTLIYDNVDEHYSYGFETNIAYSMDLFSIHLGYSYVIGKAVDILDPDPNSDDIIDHRYVCFPKHIIIVGFYYSYNPFGVHFFLNNRVYLDMKEAPVNVIYNPDDLPNYVRTDLSINKNIIEDRLQVQLNICNLFNRDNYLPSILGLKNGLPDKGITALLRLSYEF